MSSDDDTEQQQQHGNTAGALVSDSELDGSDASLSGSDALASSSEDASSSSTSSPRTRRSLRRSTVARDQQQQRRHIPRATARANLRQHDQQHKHQRAVSKASGASLWRAREAQFEKFRAATLVLPVPPSVVRVARARGYSLHILSVLNWVLPDSLLRARCVPVGRRGTLPSDSDGADASDNDAGDASDSDDAGDDELLVTLGVHVSLFHAASKRFFGNTWVSPELALDPRAITQRRHSTDASVCHVVERVALHGRAYFLSDVVDASCVGVVELVAYEKDPDSKATISVVGCGWTILPLFASSSAAEALGGGTRTATGGRTGAIGAPADFTATSESVSVFSGSPRVLWELPQAAWHAQAQQDRCQCYYALERYDPLLAAAPFLRQHELVGALDAVPGLHHGNLANIDVGRSAKLLLLREAAAATDTAFSDALAAFAKLASLVPRSIALAETVTLRVLTTRVAVHLRQEVEANLVARLQISRARRHAGATRIDGHVSARVLQLALHNGRRFCSRLHTVALKPEQPGSDHLRCCGAQTPAVTALRGFVLHAHVAVVVTLQFTVHFRLAWPAKTRQQALDAKQPPPPEEDVVLVTMGVRTLVPSDGKKLYLYDKHQQHHHASASVAPLEPLGSGDAAVSAAHAQSRRILHVELLSGAPCRPYSDNVLYTPAVFAAGGKSLEKHARLALHDSIAFVDLSLAVDGEGGGGKSLVKSPVRDAASPTKTPPSAKSRRGNQSDSDSGDGDDDGDSKTRAPAAERWAAKMLHKAGKSALLAQTLDALAATAAASPKAAHASVSQPPASPAKQKPPSSSTRTDPAPLLPPHAQTSGLSRASKTLLTRYGFMDAHDTCAIRHDARDSPPRRSNQRESPCRGDIQQVPAPPKSLDVELRDIYKAHEVRFHFAAFRSFRAAPCVPARVYFTFQFYSFPPTRTETLRLSKPFENGAGGASQTFLLLRESPASKPALAIQFDVDTTAALDPLEPRHFIEYLLRSSLYVDVWDADSLFQLGTFAVPLHELLRQGSGIKKFQAEVDVVEPLESRYSSLHEGGGDDDEGARIGDANDGCISVDASADRDVIGKVQFLVSNYGVKGRHVLPPSAAVVTPPQAAAVAAALPAPSRLGANNQAGAATHARVKHRVRARPLVDANAELYRLLAHEGFYGAADGTTRRERKRSDTTDKRHKQQARGLSDATSLSPAEVAILCDLFGVKRGVGVKAGAAFQQQQQRAALTRSARIECDLEGRTGLLALLAVGPQLQSQSLPSATYAKQQTTRVPDLVTARVQPTELANQPPPNALHVDRLRRVLSIVQSHQVGLDSAFALFDTDGDGFLSRDEFVQALRSMGTVFTDVSDAELLAIVAAMDANSDGRVDYKEFRTFLAAQLGQPVSVASQHKSAAQWRDEVQRILVRAMEKGIAVHKIFIDLDASGDGHLSYDEFGRALQKLGVPADQEQLHRSALMREFDADGDGQVSFAEFLASLGISFEASKVQIVRDTVKDIGATVRETLARVAAQGIELTQVFAHFDADKSGKLSVAEFTQALEQLVQPSSQGGSTSGASGAIQALELESLRAFVATVNANGDDEIDYREFLSLCNVSGQALAQQAEQHAASDRVAAEKKLIKLLVRALQGGMRIEQIFAHFDANADGRVSLSEFRQALDALFCGATKELTAHDTATIAARFDADGDREVSFQEFQSFAREIERHQRTLARVLTPHVARLTEVEQQTSKLALGKWQQLCTREFKLSRQDADALKPLLPYFELVDTTKKVDLTQLCALLKAPAASASASTPDDPMVRLKALLLKAKAMGLDTAKLFAEFDANSDGEVSRSEFASLLQQLGCFTDISDAERDAMLARVDSDGSGKISLHEFKALLGESCDDPAVVPVSTSSSSTSQSASAALLQRFTALLDAAVQQGFDVAKCFAHFDTDSGGQITASEFVVGMQQLGLGGVDGSSVVASGDDETLREVFRSLDRDGSGEISIAEFKALFTSAGAAGASSLQSTPEERCIDESDGKHSTGPQRDSRAPAPKQASSKAVAGTATATATAETSSVKHRLRSLLQLAEQNGNDVSVCFSHFDSDGDGKITHDEFVQGMKALPGFEAVAEDELLALVAALDSDASGSVSLDEFRMFMTAASSGDEQQQGEKLTGGTERPHGTAASTETPVAESRAKEASHSADAVDATPPVTQDLDPSQDEASHDDAARSVAGDSAMPPDDVTEATAETATPAAETKPVTAAKPRALGSRPTATRASSFAAAKSKPLPSFAARRTKTDSASVAAAAVSDGKVDVTTPAEDAQSSSTTTVADGDGSGELKSSAETTAGARAGRAPLQRAPSLVAARAAKAAANRAAAKAAASSAVPASAVSAGLDKLRTLLLTAQQQGIDIHASFRHFDADENGRLTYAEFARGVKQLGPDFEQLGDTEVDGMAKALDQRQGGEILVQDLVQLVNRPSPADVVTVVAVDSAISAGVLSETPITKQFKSSESNAAASATGANDVVIAARKRAPMSTRTPSEGSVSAASQAPVRRTSSLRLPLKSSAGVVAADKGASGATPQAPDKQALLLKSDLTKPLAKPDEVDAIARAPAAAAVSTVGSLQAEMEASAPPTDVITNCAYVFHSDPQIRSVELKLRRAAVDAHARGILPLRVVTKFLDQDDDASHVSARTSRRRKRTELLRVEFLQVLMELGFSLLSETESDAHQQLDWSDSPSSSGRPHPTTRMNDHLYARQLERLSRYRHHVKEESKAQKQLVRAVTKSKSKQQLHACASAAEDSLRRFADEKHQLLRVLSYYRDGQKKALVYSLLRDQVTTTIALAPRFAALLFLELPFANPYKHHERFRLEVVLPQRAVEAAVLDLDIVKSDVEWAYYRDHVPLAFGSASSDSNDCSSSTQTQSPVENEMIDDANEVVMDAHDRIAIPVRLRWLDARLACAGATRTTSASDAAAVVPASVAVRSCTHGHTVALFKFELRPQPLICHRVLRFSHPGGSIWRVRLRCPRGKFVVCMDPSVAVDSTSVADSNAHSQTAASNRVVGLKCRVGEYPALEQFYLVLYDDEYFASVYEVWQVRIQAKLRLDLHAVLGQSFKSELIIRGDSSSIASSSSSSSQCRRRHVQCFTTFGALHEVQFRPAQVFQLVPNAFNRIALSFCTTELLRAPQCRVLVNLVDVESHELVGAWVLHVALSLPRITKTYELRLPLAQPAQKKIAYTNAWDEPQTIVLRSSAPTRLQLRDAVLQVPRSGSVFLRLCFPAVAVAARDDIFLFINDRDTDENEECLLFRVTYAA